MPPLKLKYIHLFLVLTAIIGGVEYALMLTFDFMDLERNLPASMLSILDALCLIFFSALPTYLWVIQPLFKDQTQYRKRLETLVTALDGAADCIMITNAEGNITYVNQSFADITGYTAKEAIGQNPRILQSGKQNDSFYSTMWHDLTTTGQWHGELWNKRKDGREYLEHLHIKAVMDQSGGNPSYVGIITDITAKKEQDAMLAEAEKIASIGTLVAGIAHNFNNLLSGIIGNAYLAQNSQNTEATNKRLKTIERISFNASEMVKKLLIFARKHDPKKENVSIIPLVHQTIEKAHMEFDNHVAFDMNITDEPLTLYCDTDEIQQAILNILKNAHEALPTSGKRWISISVTKEPWGDCKHYATCQGCITDMLKITIQDSGSGISDEDIPHIFEPFYTTKAVGQGTGLGLSTAMATVQSHGGRIQVENNSLASGCTFEICLPLSFTSPKDYINRRKVAAVAARRKATILLVDDEDMVRSTLSQVLQSLGYKTVIATNGQEASDIVLSEHRPIDLVITDIMMPKTNGMSGVKCMRKQFPHLPVIFITGYGEELSKIQKDSITQNISKPFDINRLSHQIDALLHPTTPPDWVI